MTLEDYEEIVNDLSSTNDELTDENERLAGELGDAKDVIEILQAKLDAIEDLL